MGFDIKSEFSKLKKTNKEEFSKIMLKNKKEFDSMFKKSEKIVGYVKENLEDKFSSLKYEYEKDFLKNLDEFKKNLNKKEKEFFNKYIEIENKQNSSRITFEKFKTEVILWCDKIKKEIIEESKRVFEESKLLHKNKENMTKFLNNKLEKFIFSFERKVNVIVAKSIFKQIKKQNKEFFENETFFRNNFSEKVKNLEESQKSFLDSFRENLFTEVKRSFDFESTREILKSKQEELDIKINTFDEKIKISNLEISDIVTLLKDDFLKIKENMINEIKKLIDSENLKFEDMRKGFEVKFEKIENINSSYLENIEERILDFEKTTNKQFLDVENDFTTFKTNILNEFDEVLVSIKTSITSRTNLNLKKTIEYLKNRQDKFENKINLLLEKDNRTQ